MNCGVLRPLTVGCSRRHRGGTRLSAQANARLMQSVASARCNRTDASGCTTRILSISAALISKTLLPSSSATISADAPAFPDRREQSQCCGIVRYFGLASIQCSFTGIEVAPFTKDFAWAPLRKYASILRKFTVYHAPHQSPSACGHSPAIKHVSRIPLHPPFSHLHSRQTGPYCAPIVTRKPRR
jgi:hypothetical protein